MATHDRCDRELQTAIERERSRIARDLHDGVAQQLVLVLLKLEYVQRILEEPAEATADQWSSIGEGHAVPLDRVLQPARAEIERAHTILYESLSDLRHCISSLVPAQMERKSFSAALQELVHVYEDAQCKISCTLSDVEHLPSHLEVPVFRFVQEALSNIRKHAQATWIAISLSIQADMLSIEVSDNGKGFRAEQILHNRGGPGSTEHIGLRCMRERISEAGGEWGIESRPGGGTQVHAYFTL